MAKATPIKPFKLTFDGKGKKTPFLPVGVIGTLKAGSAAALVVRNVDNQVFVRAADLLADNRLLKTIVAAQAANKGCVLNVKAPQANGKTKLEPFVSLRTAVLIAATENATTGGNNEINRSLLTSNVRGNLTAGRTAEEFLAIGVTAPDAPVEVPAPAKEALPSEIAKAITKPGKPSTPPAALAAAKKATK